MYALFTLIVYYSNWNEIFGFAEIRFVILEKMSEKVWLSVECNDKVEFVLVDSIEGQPIIFDGLMKSSKSFNTLSRNFMRNIFSTLQ